VNDVGGQSTYPFAVGDPLRAVDFRVALDGGSMFRVDEKIVEGRAGEIRQRWGVTGLAVIGGVVLGPTITLAAALVLGVDRRRFGIW
jgi:hypothetical protein